MHIELPTNVTTVVTNIFGARGAAWLAALPAEVTRLCRRWDLTVTGPCFEGGTHSYVAPVMYRGGPAVLKVPVLDEENYAESAALRCYDGDGAVRLYEVDLDTGALVLEHAPGPSLLDRYEHGDLALAEVVDIAAGLLRRLCRIPTGDLSVPLPPPAEPDALAAVPEQPFPRVVTLARRWACELPAEHDGLGRPYDHGLFTEAARFSAEFADVEGPDVLVNRDGHTGNILAGVPGRPWLLIDPKPMVGEAAFDAGHLLWDLLRYDPTIERARYLVDRLAAGLAVDRERVRGWAFVRAVDNIGWAHPAGEAAPYVAAATALRAA